MNQASITNNQRIRRKNRTRGRMLGTADRPRLTVARSNTRISAQLIDDMKGVTVCAASGKKGVAEAGTVGRKIGEAAKEAGILKAVFDRGAYRYHGNVKAVAEGARAAGLQL
jgi:large subunit ribosomal protein L18